MESIIYRIDDGGNIEKLAAYALPAKQALKCAYLQLIRDTWNTWEYDNINVNIIDGERTHYIPYGDNSTLCARKDAEK